MIKKPPVKREWYRCPGCGKKALIYDNTAHCSGVYLKCKNCGREFEVKI
nr:MAG TPA: zinc-ribbon domain protein [Caudoviricetes sp.]